MSATSFSGHWLTAHCRCIDLWWSNLDSKAREATRSPPKCIKSSFEVLQKLSREGPAWGGSFLLGPHCFFLELDTERHASEFWTCPANSSPSSRGCELPAAGLSRKYWSTVKTWKWRRVIWKQNAPFLRLGEDGCQVEGAVLSLITWLSLPGLSG